MAKRFLFSGSEQSYFGKCLELGEAIEKDFVEHFSKYQRIYYKEKPNFNDGDTAYKYAVVQILDDEEGKFSGFEKPGYYQII